MPGPHVHGAVVRAEQPTTPPSPRTLLAPSVLGAPTTRRALPAGRSGTAPAAPAPTRVRGVPAPDVVLFTATCPGCGRDAEWLEEREDTRLRLTVSCDCA